MLLNVAPPAGVLRSTGMSAQLIAGAVAPPGPYDLDVVILAMDRSEDTVEAIRSACGQVGGRHHVIVFDQGSSPEHLERLAGFAQGRSDVALYRSERNWGVAGGRNRATALGHGRVIIALDNDAEFAGSGTGAAAVAALDAQPDLAALAFRVVIFDTGEDDLSSWGFPTALLPRAAATFDVATFVGAGHAIRRQAWDAAGGYDDALFFCWEEYDFALRAISKGWRVEYRGDIVVRHKVSPERRFSWSGTRWFYFVRNRLYIERKWSRSWLPALPRAAGYAVKGIRNGATAQTMRALPAALALYRRSAVRDRMSRQGAAYLDRNDRAHRGTILSRVRREVLARLPGQG